MLYMYIIISMYINIINIINYINNIVCNNNFIDNYCSKERFVELCFWCKFCDVVFSSVKF